MKRVKRHKIKNEKPETSSTFTRAMEEHDLVNYIHDRVELMHQVFSVLKSKDIRAMAPECVRRLSIDDLQELCTEELLGISSKRLLAILDGAEPPSDTESSSQSSELMEAISLDSISSDEEILSQGTKKKRKHKRRDSKSKKHKSKKAVENQGDPEKSKASRAGLTVLELLELQARARAIRAQLQQEQAKKPEATQTKVSVESSSSSDSDIEVKEEPAEVVEIISSDDEKPQIELLEKAIKPTTKESDKVINNKNQVEETTENTDSNKSKKKRDKEKKKDKSKKKDKQKKQKEISKDNSNDKAEKELTSSKDTDKTKDATESTRKDSTASTETESTTKSSTEDNKTITRRRNDLIITIPKNTTRKIKLNRSKMTISIPNNAENEDTVIDNTRSVSSVVTRPEKPDDSRKICSVVSRPKSNESVVSGNQAKPTLSKDKNIADKGKTKDKSKKKLKKKPIRDSVDEDHDEITLQLSDSEKMDLLENFDKRNYDDVSSSSSDSDSSSDSNDSEENKDELETSQDKTNDDKETTLDKSENNVSIPVQDDTITVNDTVREIEVCDSEEKYSTEQPVVDSNKKEKTASNEDEENSNTKINESDPIDSKLATEIDENIGKSINEKEAIETPSSSNDTITKSTENTGYISIDNDKDNIITISKIDDIPIQADTEKESKSNSDCKQNEVENKENSECRENSPNVNDENCENNEKPQEITETNKVSDKELSEGELSDRESSDVEAYELQPEVVCISDEETPKKKKKKEKKAKKDKKKKSDFRESADQNFFKDSVHESINKESNKAKEENHNTDQHVPVILDDEDDDVYEILELSDDSSCYEVEGTTLSKEPTVKEIEALSAKIDEIEREEVVTEEEIRMHEQLEEEKRENTEKTTSKEDIENISWKDRYLDSKKVKKVLSTSSILNALRKKNKELKKKMEESKKREQEQEAQKESEKEAEEEITQQQEKVFEEGSIEQYNTLEGSTKYVDPVSDPVELAKKKEEELKEQEIKEAAITKEKEREIEEAIEAQVSGEMKKDAKQLLKMYKKLLKYNDIKKQKDPNKKKSKKKKKKEKDSVAIGVSS